MNSLVWIERKVEEKNLLWTWHNPTENCASSGICLRISSVTKWTPRCWGRKLILRWNHAEPICKTPVLLPAARWFDDAIIISAELLLRKLWLLLLVFLTFLFLLVAVLNNFIEHYFTRKNLVCALQTVRNVYRDDIFCSLFPKQTQSEKSLKLSAIPF